MISARLRAAAAAAGDVPTPFYLFDTAAIVETARSMTAAWHGSFPRFTLAYSYKTNSLAGITRLLRDAGAAAEVVSGAELSAALADGFESSQVYFDGPVKLPGELDQAVAAGVTVQLDSLDEVTTLLAARPANPPRVTLRLAVRRGRRRWSRFGFLPVEIDEARGQLARAGVPVRGIHFNTGVHPLDSGPYRAVLRDWRDVLRTLHAEAGEPMIVDIGGGFPAASCAPGTPLPPWSVYPEGIADQLHAIGIPPGDVHLVIEPGRSLVEDHAVMVAAVAVRKRRHRRDVVVVDGGTNLVRSITAWPHPVEFLEPGQVPYDVYGAMCYESDLFAERVNGPATLALGDRLLVGAAGGYDIPSANVWVRPRPAVYAIAESGARPAALRAAGTDIR